MKFISRSVASFSIFLLIGATPGFATTWLVDTADFSGMWNTCDDLTPYDCSIAGALDNHNFGGGTNVIGVASGVGELVIEPYATLDITTGDLTITSDPTASDRIVLSGPGDGSLDAISIDASNVTVNGLIINNGFNNGILVESGTNITITNNYIGVASDGTTPSGNTLDGISFNGTFTAGTFTIANNIISGNGSDGIEFAAGGAYPDNVEVWIYANKIGVASNGTTAVPNGQHGIYAPETTTSSIDFTIGGNYDGTNPSTEGNTIRSNGGMGVKVESGDSVRLAGNTIYGNGSDGIYLDAGSSLDTNTDILIGTNNDAGDDSSEGNIISANDGYGINVSGAEAEDIFIAGNSIGGNSAGQQGTGIENTKDGIYISSTNASDVSIGAQSIEVTNPQYTRNWIISNGGGINIDEIGIGATVKVQNNYIGIDSALAAAGNVYDSADSGTDPDGSGDGFTISNVNDLTYLYIGKDNVPNDSGEPNYIGNNVNGIDIGDANLGVVFIMGNYIGTDGTSDHGNTSNGIYVNSGVNVGDLNIGTSDSTDDVVFTGPENANTISANGAYAIYVSDLGINSPAPDVTIGRNLIGSTSAGADNNLGNASGGIYIVDGNAINITDNTIIDNTGDGVSIASAVASAVYLTGNYIGMQSSTVGPSGNSGNGIYISASSMTSVGIGGDAADGDSNIITANGGDGILIDVLASNTSDVTVQGNYIGFCVDPTTGGSMSTTGCGNTGDGIDLRQGAVTIGGAHSLGTLGTGSIGQGNFIGNNGEFGVRVTANVASFSALGNMIGVYRSGATSAPDSAGGNTLDGIYVNSTVTASVGIGSAASVNGNVISANSQYGIDIVAVATGATVNIYAGKYGTNYLGTAALANAIDGIRILDGTGAIGGVSTDQANLISGNTGRGIYIGGTAEDYNIYANTIGLDLAKNSAIPNGDVGIYITDGAAGSTFNIGSSTTGSANYISGNTYDGVNIAGSTAITVNILKNIIGLNGAATADLGNGADGIKLENASATVVIGDNTTPANGINHISGNAGYGVNITGGTVTMNGNYIGLDITGATVLDNDLGSVYIADTAGSVAAVTILSVASAISNTANVGISTNKAITNESTVYSADNVFTDLTGPYSASTICSTTSCAPYYRRDTATIIPASEETTTTTTNTSVGGGGDGGVISLAPVTPTAPDVAKDFLDELKDTLEVDQNKTKDIRGDEALVDSNDNKLTEERTTAVDNLLSEPEVRKKLEQAINTNTDLILGTKKIELETSLSNLIAQESLASDQEDVFDSPEKQENRVIVQEALESLALGEDSPAIEKIESLVYEQLAKEFDQALSDGKGGLTLNVDGYNRTFTSKPKITFSASSMEAKNLNKEAREKGSDELFIAPDDDLLGTGVSLAAELSLLGTVLDPKANEKLWFFGAEEAPKIPRISLPGHKHAMFAPNRSFVIVGPAGAAGKAYVLNSDQAVEDFDKFNGECSDEYCFEAGDFEVGEANRTEIKIDFNQVLSHLGQTVENTDSKHSYYILLVSDRGSSIVEVTIDFALEGDDSIKSGNISFDEDADAGQTVLSGVADPNSIIFVSWKSITKNSVVIADASQGYFEVEAPQGLAAEDHEAVFYAFNPNEGFASNFSNIFFKKIF